MMLANVRIGPLRILVLLILLAAAGLGWMWFDQHAQLRGVVWVAPKLIAPDLRVPSSALAPIPAASNPGLYATILERPLFAPDRRLPPPPPPPTPPPPPDPLANIRIHGIFSGPDAGILARVDGKMRRIKLNEQVGPWTLKSTDGRNVTFTQGEQSRELRLVPARLDTPVAPAPVITAPIASPPKTQALLQEAVPQDQKVQDEVRDRLRRRNELRASRGLPPLTE